MSGPLDPPAVDTGPVGLRVITLLLVTRRGIEHDGEESHPWP